MGDDQLDELTRHAYMMGRVYRDPEGRKVRVYGLGRRLVAYVIEVGDKKRTTRAVPVDWLERWIKDAEQAIEVPF